MCFFCFFSHSLSFLFKIRLLRLFVVQAGTTSLRSGRQGHPLPDRTSSVPPATERESSGGHRRLQPAHHGLLHHPCSQRCQGAERGVVCHSPAWRASHGACEVGSLSFRKLFRYLFPDRAAHNFQRWEINFNPPPPAARQSNNADVDRNSHLKDFFSGSSLKASISSCILVNTQTDSKVDEPTDRACPVRLNSARKCDPPNSSRRTVLPDRPPGG